MLIGYADVKSTPVYFYVQTNWKNHSNSSASLNCQHHHLVRVTRTNVGNAMNPSTGVFTAPRPGKISFHLFGISNVAGSQIELHLNGVLMGTAFSSSSTSWALSNCNGLPFLILVFIIQFFYSIYRSREEIATSGLTSFREQLRNFTEIFVYIPLGSGKFTFSPPERIVRSMAKKESRRLQLWYPQVIWFSYFVLV